MLWQLTLNALTAASAYALVAIGFTVIYRTSHVFHLAHGIVFAAGAYFLYLFWRVLGLPCLPAAGLGVLACALLGCWMEVVIYKRLRRRDASSLVCLVASLGAYVVLQNAISLAFTDETLSLRSSATTEGINILGARMTPIQILIVAASLVSVAALGVFLGKTRLGMAMRAVADDRELAMTSGIASDRVVLAAFVVGSSLAGIAGMLVALDVDLTPTMGMRAILMALVVVLIGGVGSIRGLLLGALLLGTAQQLVAWEVSAQWQDAAAFALLLVFLIVRPQGFLGKRVRKATV